MWEHEFQNGPQEPGTCPTGRYSDVPGPTGVPCGKRQSSSMLHAYHTQESGGSGSPVGQKRPPEGPEQQDLQSRPPVASTLPPSCANSLLPGLRSRAGVSFAEHPLPLAMRAAQAPASRRWTLTVVCDTKSTHHDGEKSPQNCETMAKATDAAKYRPGCNGALGTAAQPWHHHCRRRSPLHCLRGMEVPEGGRGCDRWHGQVPTLRRQRQGWGTQARPASRPQAECTKSTGQTRKTARG